MSAIDIRKRIDQDLVKKIFGNQKNAIDFLRLLGINEKVKKANDAYELIVKHWEYNKAYKVIRQIFESTPKYQKGKLGEDNIKVLLSEWVNLGFGNVEWPFSQGQFDNFVQHINSSTDSRDIKDSKVKTAAVRYRRIKEINTERNDYLETMIFLNNENVIPTLHHSRGLDFFIDGVSFDQKVSKSPTNEFKRDFGENWRDVAINHPEKVAEYLYTYQDEGRFGQEPRLFIVYLDEDVEPIKIKSILEKNKLKTPYSITFKYSHKVLGKKTYKTEAFVILLGNDL
ncbi:hypothetical protein RO21_00160 [[Actinobacillus] muris]|uniref:Uncharacterized protein n=1 Tax=Muribacter muris TaxID=67855 RepID=A0A0J5S6U1_9PAST|nr:hypothetical protein [Muribacter muris]KMK52582.1 hypothetical protein RO21_00160 [[Actinobacillus] muris] [Muribacter muris]